MGREGSKYGIEDYLVVKYLCLGVWTADRWVCRRRKRRLSQERRRQGGPAPQFIYTGTRMQTWGGVFSCEGFYCPVLPASSSQRVHRP